MPIWNNDNTIKICNKGDKFYTYAKVGNTKNSYHSIIVDGKEIKLSSHQYIINNNDSNDDSYYIERLEYKHQSLSGV